jgi:hypothetical protein
MGRKAGGLGSLSLAPGQFFIGGLVFIPAGNSKTNWVRLRRGSRVRGRVWEGLREKAAQAEVGLEAFFRHG